MAYVITFADDTKEIELIEGADAYQQEGPLTTFFRTSPGRSLVDSWSTRLASFRTADIRSVKLVIKGDRYTVTVGKQLDRGTVKLDPEAKPKALDITGTDGPNKGKTIRAIYERDGDTLRVCYDLSGKGRPKEFKTSEGTQLFLVTYKRQKP